MTGLGRARWIGALGLISGLAIGLAAAGCGGSQGVRPQVQVVRIGEPLPPLPEKSQVKIFINGEPSRSYREVGRVTSTCPVKHWVGGQEKAGRPVCLAGLRQGARKLGAEAVLEVETERIRPDWAPDQPWLIMRGVAVKLLP